MSEITVFVVYYGMYDQVDDIEAIFETEEQVNAFRNRFAKNHPLKVITRKLNPQFISVPDKIPYLVCFNSVDLKPFEVDLLNGIEDCNKAAKDIIEQEGSFFYFYLFANNKSEAIRLARNKRDELLKSLN